MGFFDKLFNSDSNEPHPEEIRQGIIINNDDFVPVELKGIPTEYGGVITHGVMRDPSKAIDAILWDGLTSEAQEALSKQGFYRKDDDYKEVIIIEP